VVVLGSVDGDVELDELLPLLSTVPCTSTLCPTYFERSSLPLALNFSPLAHALGMDADEPVVPVVGLVVGFVLLVVPAVLLLEPLPIDTLLRTKSPDEVVDADGVVVPVVPAVAA
jgi:hypothetical protein